MATIPKWHVAGDWFDVCSCNIPCPCEFAQPPTNNRCFGVLVYHIRDGHFGDIPLSNLNLLLVGTFEGNLWTGKRTGAKLGLFLDARANDPQRDAMGAIFAGHAGGEPARLAALWGEQEILGMEVAPIEFEIAGDLAFWRARIEGKVMAEAQALTGPTTPHGKRVQTLNPPGSEVGPGQVATWGVATRNRVDALGLKWEHDGKSSKHIPFDWSGPD